MVRRPPEFHRPQMVFFRMFWDTFLGDLSEFELLTVLIITESFQDQLFFSWMMIWSCDRLRLCVQELIWPTLKRRTIWQLLTFGENLGKCMNLGLDKENCNVYMDEWMAPLGISTILNMVLYMIILRICFLIHLYIHLSIFLSNYPSIQKIPLEIQFDITKIEWMISVLLIT